MNDCKNTDENHKISFNIYGQSHTCLLCNVTCNGELSFNQHINGAAHKRNTNQGMVLLVY